LFALGYVLQDDNKKSTKTYCEGDGAFSPTHRKIINKITKDKRAIAVFLSHFSSRLRFLDAINKSKMPTLTCTFYRPFSSSAAAHPSVDLSRQNQAPSMDC
jgi:hypothetical protein